MANKNKFLLIFIFVALVFLRYLYLISISPRYIDSKIWSIQSIDVMKYSRDLAREKLNDPSFDSVINSQLASIASTGATHVGLGVPYDDEFLPIMRRWVFAARANGLKIWFRGNLSGWEGWFEYKLIDRATHTQMIRAFIINNADLFEDGDLFSSCPECENGSLGDPRQVGGVEEYRNFLVAETDAVRESFRKIGKNIPSDLHSMNGDVARLVMNKETTKKLGGLVVIDHYVASPEKLASDIKEIANSSGGRVILGEFGAPIPDIHGNMSELQQSAWINKALKLISEDQSCLGLNYWTSFGGSTKLWNDDGTERLAVNAIRSYYKPAQYKSQVVTWFNLPLSGASIVEDGKEPIYSSRGGFFSLPMASEEPLTVSLSGFSVYRSPIRSSLKIVLEPNSIYSVLRIFLLGI